MIRTSALAIPFFVPLLALAGCKPPPTDEATARSALVEDRGAPSLPIESPDAINAIWAESREPGRILYGNPGETPMIALTCIEDEQEPRIRFTRYALADEGASALLALIGNGHIARLPVEATDRGGYFLWQGEFPATSPDLEVLTGTRDFTATIPGAGLVEVHASERPAELVEACRALVEDVEAAPEEIDQLEFAGEDAAAF